VNGEEQTVSRAQQSIAKQHGFRSGGLRTHLLPGAASVGIPNGCGAPYPILAYRTFDQPRQLAKPDVDDQDSYGDIVLQNYVLAAVIIRAPRLFFSWTDCRGFSAGSFDYVSAFMQATHKCQHGGAKFFGCSILWQHDANESIRQHHNAYIGLGFPINASTENYFGWVRVSVNTLAGLS